MPVWPVLFTLLAASLLPIQAAMNGAVGRALRMPPLVVLISLLGSLIAMLAFGLATGRLGWPGAARLASVPWWGWPAGVCGAVYLLSQPVVLPRIGAAYYVGLSVTAQVGMALLIDNWGLLGLPQHPASPGRVLGVALMAAGVALVARF